MKRRAFLFLALVLAAGCLEGQNPKPQPRNPSLYTQVGREKLQVAVKRFVALAGTAPEVRDGVRADFTGDADLANRLYRPFAAALGGPYPGTVQDLGKALAALPNKPTPSDITALVTVFDKALQETGVGEQLHKEAMEALAPLKAAPEKPADDAPKD